MNYPNKDLIQAIYTERTCGDACWRAKDDICHCSCGGRNHGCLRGEHGEQPPRTKKIKGMMYQLIAVSPNPEVCQCANDAWRPIEDQLKTIEDRAIKTGVCTYGDLYYAEGYRWNNLPCYAKTPSDGEIERWAELTLWRNKTNFYKPLCLWLRVDLLQLKD